MSQNSVKNITIVGASGNVGSSTLKHLLAANGRFHVTAITRPESTATFPEHPNLTVRREAYNDAAALENAFRNQDVVMFALSFFALSSEKAMIEAAAKAGVKWIIPNEYAADGNNKEMVDGVPMFHPKRETRKYVETLSSTYPGLAWIGVATGPFTEMALERKWFGVDQEAKKATIYPDAGAFSTSTLNEIGLAVSRLLALPVESEADPRASLQHYANNFLYVSSFHLTQTMVFETAQRLTKTAAEDWQVDRSQTIKNMIVECREALQKGDFSRGKDILFAYYLGDGLGGDHHDRAEEDRRILSLPRENFEDVVNLAWGTASKEV